MRTRLSTVHEYHDAGTGAKRNKVSENDPPTDFPIISSRGKHPRFLSIIDTVPGQSPFLDTEFNFDVF